MTALIGMAYCSKPVSFSFEQVNDILGVSRENNDKADITGALIYDNRTFLQALEGKPDDIRDVFDRISHDPRHTGIRLLSVRKLEGRLRKPESHGRARGCALCSNSMSSKHIHFRAASSCSSL